MTPEERILIARDLLGMGEWELAKGLLDEFVEQPRTRPPSKEWTHEETVWHTNLKKLVELVQQTVREAELAKRRG